MEIWEEIDNENEGRYFQDKCKLSDNNIARSITEFYGIELKVIDRMLLDGIYNL